MPSKADVTSPSQIVASLARVLAHPEFATSERAKLKRMGITDAPPLAFHRFLLRHVDPAWQGSRWQQSWRVILAALAMQPAPVFNPEMSLGRALQQAGYAEARLERLLMARDETLHTLALRLARFLAAKRLACDWRQLGDLLFATTPRQRETINTRIARDYYRAVPQSDTSKE